MENLDQHTRNIFNNNNNNNTHTVLGKKVGMGTQEEIMHQVVFELSGSAFNRKKSGHYLLSV